MQLPRFLITILVPVATTICFPSQTPQCGTLTASTFLGTSGRDGQYETPMAIDGEGNIFVAGRTKSSSFPVIPGCYDMTHNGGVNDLFVSKFSPDLSTLLASTYLGGADNDGSWPGVAMALDQNGNVFVVANSSSVDLTYTYGSPGGGFDVYIAKFDNDLQTLLSARLLGGTSGEYYLQCVVDAQGGLVVSGSTNSGSTFPTTPGAYKTTFSGGGGGPYPGDVFVCRFSNDLSSMIASTFLGGSANEYCEALLIDRSGNVCLAGWTDSWDFPTTVDAFQRYRCGTSYDSFITKLSGDLSALVASTFLGGTNWDFSYAMVEDPASNIYVTGHTASTTHPTTDGAFDRTYNGSFPPSPGSDDDVFVAKLDGMLHTLLAGTYLGASGWENAMCLGILENGEVVVSGNTRSTLGFPVTSTGYDSSYNGLNDIFLVQMTNGLTEVKMGTFLGGKEDELPCGLKLDAQGNICLSGITTSSDYPTEPGSYDTSFNGMGGPWTGEEFGGDVVVTILPAGYFSDSDQDGLLDINDNCPGYPNPLQEDQDGDEVGDVCDNCRVVSNPSQEDTNSDCPAMPFSDDPVCGDACQPCCQGRVGDANGLGTYPNEVTIGDIQTLITAKFILGTCSGIVVCLKEADVNQSGGASPDCNDITISDIQTLVNHLFIVGPANAPLNECL